MRMSILALVLLGISACKTTEAASGVKSDGLALAAAPTTPAKGSKDGKPASSDADQETLLKWRVGRWSIVRNGTDTVEKMDKEGTVACTVTASLVQSKLGADKLTALKSAIADAYGARDQRQISPIFRGLDKSRELIALYNGQEYLVEKMYQSRDAIQPDQGKPVGREISQPNATEIAVALIMSVAVNPAICATVPN